MSHETEETSEAWLDDARDEEAYRLTDEEFGTRELPLFDIDEETVANQLTLDIQGPGSN